MNISKLAVFVTGITCSVAFSQELENDSIYKNHQIEEVVITGQYSAQSIDKSIYKVEVISAEDIKNFAGNTVADVLNQSLNVFIMPNRTTGNSEAQIMGLSGEYTKILVDNIPIIGDSNLGTSIDLTKLNLDNVEKIEIVKGAMGVDYGNNALAGVINIITKKGTEKKWRINAFVQEETVGEEYDWYEDGGRTKGKGRHIQSLEVQHNISDKWFASAGVSRNDFQGFWDDRKGSKHFEKDRLRGYHWLPKEQWNTNGLVSFKGDNFKAFYKVNYLLEDINYYNPIVDTRNLGEGQQTYYSVDRDYKTDRWSHHLNLDTKLFDRVLYRGDFSYQKQDRQFRDYDYDIPNRTITSKDDFVTYQSTEAYYARGTFSKFVESNNFDFQVGYELDQTEGFSNSIAGFFEGENVKRKLGSYAGFASAEINTGSGFSFRPGFRAGFSDKFDTQYNFSLSTKFDVSEKSSLRFVACTANRFPNFDELYTYFVDANHQVLGDENLNPEKGFSTSLEWSHRLFMDNFSMTNSVSTLYLNVDDRVEMVVLDYSQNINQYLNINRYESWGFNTAHNFRFNNFNAGVSASLLGISKSLFGSIHSSSGELEDEYRYTLEGNANLSYTFPKANTTLSLMYRYAGKTTEFVVDEVNSTPGQTLYRLGERDDFSLMDFSVRKGFLKNNLEVTLGARNIFDVTEVRNTALVGGAHSAAAATQSFFYGRSYFLKINYTFDFN